MAKTETKNTKAEEWLERLNSLEGKAGEEAVEEICVEAAFLLHSREDVWVREFDEGSLLVEDGDEFAYPSMEAYFADLSEENEDEVENVDEADSSRVTYVGTVGESDNFCRCVDSPLILKGVVGLDGKPVAFSSTGWHDEGSGSVEIAYTAALAARKGQKVTVRATLSWYRTAGGVSRRGNTYYVDVPFLAAPHILEGEEIKTWRHLEKDKKCE